MNILREYIQFFPETGLGAVLKAYLESEISPFPLLPMEKEDTDPAAVEEVKPVQILSNMNVSSCCRAIAIRP